MRAPRLDEVLEELRHLVERMTGKVRSQLQDALKALAEGDKALALRVIEGDREVNRLNHAIEDKVIETVALLRPLAGDLRFVISAMKTAIDLERIGDLAQNIAEVVYYRMGGRTPSEPLLTDLMRMGELVDGMVKIATMATLGRDPTVAYTLKDMDNEVDSLFYQVLQEVMDQARKGKDTVWAVNALLIARYLERVGDHACNIGEHAVYARTGQHIKLT